MKIALQADGQTGRLMQPRPPAYRREGSLQRLDAPGLQSHRLVVTGKCSVYVWLAALKCMAASCLRAEGVIAVNGDASVSVRLYVQTTEPTGGVGRTQVAPCLLLHAVVALSYNNAQDEQQPKRCVFVFISQHTCRKLSEKLFYTYMRNEGTA